MDTFFLEYRDPLFSIIIFFLFIFLITFTSYWWGRLRSDKDNKHLDKFLKQFYVSSNELKIIINSGELSEKSWLILAQTYSDKGEYENTIEIYIELLKLQNNEYQKKHILFLLGNTYLKAGFLQRAKKIFLQILQNNPRTPEVLKSLLLVYEQMREYQKACEVLIPLEELEEDISTQDAYLKVMIILNDIKLSSQEKVDNLIKLYTKSYKNTHLIFEYLFKTDPKKAWKNLYMVKNHELLIDILWLVDIKDLDLDIITKDSYLMQLYTARGDLNLAKKSDVFEFDILIHLDSKANATLGFEYMCDNCKQVLPFSFSRCSKCHSIDSLVVEYRLIKDYYRDFSEENNSFQ
jgi:tetratricopeptide (TPR) repeat protein